MLRLRTIFMVVALLVLLLPLAAVYYLRLYENELVRQTESELIAQGSVIAAIYRNSVMNAPADYGIPAQHLPVQDGNFLPVLPQIDLVRDPLLPGFYPSAAANEAIEPLSLAAGEALTPVIQDATRTTLAGIRVVNAQGVVVATSREELHSSLAEVEEIQQALTGLYASTLRERTTDYDAPLVSLSRIQRFRVFVVLPIFRNDRIIGAVMLSRTPQNIMKALYAKRGHIAIAGGITLGLALLLMLFIALGLTRPLHRLIRQTQAVAEGKPWQNLPMPHTREIADLTRAFESMALKVQERSDYIRNFAMHLSHEFKTPLTSMRGTAELLQEHLLTMEPEKRDRFLTIIVQDTARLQQLVARMLELARADMLQPEQGTAEIQMVLDGLKAEYAERGLTIRDTTSNLIIPMPADIVQMILRNLFDNSMKHGATETQVTVEASDNTTFITLQDNGEGITDANREKLFTPFFTTRREYGGTGLGLVIVQSLVRVYGGTISVQRAENGACFRLNLPSAQNLYISSS